MVSNWITILILAVALLLGLFLLGMMRRRPAKRSRRGEISYFEKEFAEHKWQQIQELVGIAKPSALRQAVIEADKLLDYVLKGKKFRGETLGERLKAAREAFSDNDGVWYAHKLRNRLVHEAEYEAMAYELRDALKHFERALKDLGAV